MVFNEDSVRAAIAAQQDAAHDDSPQVRTIAGPGTGKSFTIEERVCWLLGRGVQPASIAAVSFTRAAATDLERRIRAACEQRDHDHSAISISTLHALGLRALKAHGALTAYPVDPTVFDRWEVRNIFDAEFGQAEGIPSITRRDEIRTDFETFWSTGSRAPRPSQKPPSPAISEAERAAFRRFHAPRTQLYACVLPGEIVQRCVQLMDAGTLDPVDLLGIEHMIVDEFQDLNPMDLRFVKGIADRGAVLFVAGDDDQSLYSFRYALPEGIQKFADDYQGCGDHTLRHCFRCTPAVLAAAESLIAANQAPGRIPKRYISLYADADPHVEGGLGCWRFLNGWDEARAIAASCRSLIDKGMPPRQIMVLLSNVRKLGWTLQAAFEELDVPFEPPREALFKDTEVGRALLTALRIVEAPQDFVALRTLLALRKGVGAAAADGIAEVAIERDLLYRDLFYEPLDEDAFSTRELSALRPIRAVAQELAEWSNEDTLGDRREDLRGMVEAVLNKEPESDWEDETEQLQGDTTLAELARYLSAEKDEQKAAVLAGIARRLGDDDTSPEEHLPAKVRVMTMHGSKGLSAHMVFIPGLEEDTLPGPRRKPYVGQVLEAARMLFVSITRARLGCVVSFADHRVVNGKPQPQHPSRFTAHLGKPFERRTGGMPADVAKRAVRASEHL